ncbi:lanC-like protein 3 [Diachasmimorpha longicaudata]|uniref:lanC-like protein 3 n=1 Tax=Diachasmimorpha longicaudata TaxID=58733 RepID=UPI0030B891E0
MFSISRLILSESTRPFHPPIKKSQVRFITNVSAMSKRSRHLPNPYDLTHEPSEVLQTDLQYVREELLPNVEERITQTLKPGEAEAEGELYVGAAGIAYAFYHTSQVAPAPRALRYQQLAQNYLQSAMQAVNRRGKHLNSGFLCGDAGVIAVAAAISATTGDSCQANSLGKLYADLAEICKSPGFLQAGSDEFFVGRAGYLYGAIWLNKTFGREVVPLGVIHQLGETVVLSGQKYSVKFKSPCPLMYSYYGTEYLGAAHGLSSILQVLIQIPNFLDANEEFDRLVHDSVDFLLSLESRSGNYPCALDETGPEARREEDELVHWCHGAPGVVYLLAAAHRRYQDPRYLQACLRAGDLIWQRGLLRKGPGICHGVAGNGYVFLLLHRLTNDPLHLRRAAKFARFLGTNDFKRHARTPDTPFSLYEGLAGTLCFLVDLECPESAAFPFQDPFL